MNYYELTGQKLANCQKCTPPPSTLDYPPFYPGATVPPLKISYFKI